MGKAAPGQREATYPSSLVGGVGHCGWGGIDLGARWPWVGTGVFYLSCEAMVRLLWEVNAYSSGSEPYVLPEAGRDIWTLKPSNGE